MSGSAEQWPVNPSHEALANPFGDRGDLMGKVGREEDRGIALEFNLLMLTVVEGFESSPFVFARIIELQGEANLALTRFIVVLAIENGIGVPAIMAIGGVFRILQVLEIVDAKVEVKICLTSAPMEQISGIT
jgi:hypothetical protein